MGYWLLLRKTSIKFCSVIRVFHENTRFYETSCIDWLIDWKTIKVKFKNRSVIQSNCNCAFHSISIYYVLIISVTFPAICPYSVSRCDIWMKYQHSKLIGHYYSIHMILGFYSLENPKGTQFFLNSLSEIDLSIYLLQWQKKI